jgi:hypothetical protein
MTATRVPSRPDPTRTGTVWVTGTGAFLLLAAAAVFTAMRWDQIPDAAKLAALGLATGACLLAGRGLKASLPATAGALFHLGTFLVPIDVAAIGIHADLDWSSMLLAQGLVATATFGWAALVERSVVLRWSTGAAVVALAGGIGATTELPAPLVLAGFAAVALRWRRDDVATTWAALAGIAPLLTFVERLTITGAGTLDRLGLTGEQPRVAAVLTGITAAAVLAVAGRRREDVGLVLVGAAVAALGVIASWTGSDADAGTSLVGLAAVFLLLQLTALAVRHDDFWRVPADVVAQIAEWIAGYATVIAAFPILLAPVTDATHGREALAALTLGVGWLAADRRRGSRGLVLAAVAMAICGASAVALGTASDPLLAATLTGLAGLALLSGHRASPVVAVAGACWAPVVALESPTTLVAVGVLGSLLMAETAVRRTTIATDDPVATDKAEQWGWVISAVALVPGGLAMAGYIAQTGHVAAALITGAVLATVVAAVADRGRVTGDLRLGTLPRIGAVAVLAVAGSLEPAQVGLVALVVAGLSIADALRLRDPRLALGASLAIPVAVGALSRAAELSEPASGVALALSAAVLAGLGALLGRRWMVPVVAAVGVAAIAGLALAAGQPSAFADAVMIISGIGLAASVERGRLDGVLLSGLAVTGGVWLRLADADVVASEPYLLPVAVLLLGAGLRARSIGTSSWIAYGPVITLLGGAALAERVSGGRGWHALVAGSVAVVAVAAGGHRRLAAPLLLGTGLLVVLVGYETLAITAALPTWSWLAAGGVALLAAGVAMERHDLGPIETGRRLVDVVDDHFA